MNYIWSVIDELDLPQIVEIEKESFIDPWSNNMFHESMLQEHFFSFKLQIEGEIIGYISYYIIANEEAHICNLAIKKNFRGIGLSKSIFSELYKELEKINIKLITLEVRESNTVAINLYETLGFKNYGIRPKYYDNGENAIIMWQEI